MFKRHKTEVLVAGAGPVGLATALSLAEKGIEVEIVDGQWRTASRSYALALHPRSLELFDALGLAEEIVGHGHRIDRLAFYDGAERRCELSFSELGGRHPYVVVLPQQALEELLVRRLGDRNIPVKWNHRLARLDLNGQTATARVEKLSQDSTGYSAATSVVDQVLDTRTRYVVGADGHNSMVRRSLDIGFADLGDTSFFGVFEFGAEKTAGSEVRVVLTGDTTSVLWPLADGRFRWSFELDEEWEFVPDTRHKSRLAVEVGASTFPYLDEDKLGALIAERAPWFTAELGDVRWSVGVRFEHRLAERFGHGAAWLVGDAAHLASPVGVQSMNVGFREGLDLADRLVRVLRHGEDAGLLETYNTERIAEWNQLLGLQGAVAVRSGTSEWVKRHSPRIPSTIPASGEDLRHLLRQVGIEMNLS